MPIIRLRQDLVFGYRGYLMGKKIRILIAKCGLDGHDRGAKTVAMALSDAGMEVIYSGLHQTPEQIVLTAIQEAVDGIGLSILSGAHLSIFRTPSTFDARTYSREDSPVAPSRKRFANRADRL